MDGQRKQPIRDSPYGRIGVVTDNQGAVFSLTCPGTQILDRDHAIAMATLANGQLAEARRPSCSAVKCSDPTG